MSCSGGTAAPRTDGALRAAAGRCSARRAPTRIRSSCARSSPTHRRSTSASPARPPSVSTAEDAVAGARRRAGRAQLPGLPAARRQPVAHARSRRPARGDKEGPCSGSVTRRPSSRCRPPTARTTSFPASGRPAVVVFTCNHCPYALAWHERIARRGARLRGAGPARAGEPERRRALSARLLRRHARARGWRRRLAAAVPARREPGGRARVRRQDHPGRVRARRGGGAALPRRTGPRLPGPIAERVLAARGARLRAGGRGPRARPETDPVGCSVKWRE